MLLLNVNIAGEETIKHIRVAKGKVTHVFSGAAPLYASKRLHLQFNRAIIFPGLINSHDHLDFNLFSQTANGIYNNYAEWGRDIHKQNKEEINRILKIPHALRLQWGLYKNLLNGFTTVVNHGERLNDNYELIDVVQNCFSLHSVQFEKRWKYKLNRLFVKNLPFVIHAGEGTDQVSRKEIDELVRWNLFNRKIVAVHGVAMTERQAASFHSLVWCPASNFFLLNATADVYRLKIKTSVIFGSDSTLTSGWNLWEHIRLARKTKMMNDEELFNSLSKEPARVWQLNGKGNISEDYDADIVVARRKENLAGMDLFYATNPEDILLILHKGAIRLFDEELYEQLDLQKVALDNFSTIFLNGSRKYVYGDLYGLMDQVRQYYPEVRFPVSKEKTKATDTFV